MTTSRFQGHIRALLSDTAGASMIEYGLGIGLFALASLQAISAIGGEVSDDVEYAGQEVGRADFINQFGGNAHAADHPVAGGASAPVDPQQNAMGGDPNGGDPFGGGFDGPINEGPNAVPSALE